MSRPIEKAVPGTRFFKLTILEDDEPFIRKNGRKSARWLCVCDCGNRTSVLATSLKLNRTKSCGCYNNELASKLGASKRKYSSSEKATKLPEYIAWLAMLSRCYYRGNTGYKNYGGRGITVCERWRNSFLDFLKDVGKKPSIYHTLDRIDSNKNYEPCNCRWATRKEQSRNRRNVKLTEDLAKRIRFLKSEKGWGKKKISEELGLPIGCVVGVLYQSSWL